MWRKHLIGGALFLLIVVGWFAFYQLRPHPFDKSLIVNFQIHRDDFERLKSMFEKDTNLRVVSTGYFTLNGYEDWLGDTEQEFPRQRWDEYRNLFGKFGGYDIDTISRGQAHILYIPVSRVHPWMDDDYESITIEKGYAYSLREPSPLVDSLDEMDFDSRGTFYKKIGEHWYLYHEWSVSKPE